MGILKFRTLLPFLLGLWITSFAAPAPGAGNTPGPAEANKDLQGEWKVVALEADGSKAPEEALKKMRWVIKGSKLRSSDSGENPEGESTIKTDVSKTPWHIDITALEGPHKGKTVQGIYKLDKGRLTICLRDPDQAGKGRPTEFKTGKDSGVGLITLEPVQK